MADSEIPGGMKFSAQSVLGTADIPALLLRIALTNLNADTLARIKTFRADVKIVRSKLAEAVVEIGAATPGEVREAGVLPLLSAILKHWLEMSESPNAEDRGANL